MNGGRRIRIELKLMFEKAISTFFDYSTTGYHVVSIDLGIIHYGM